MTERDYRVRLTTWMETADALRHVRQRVFIEEQGVPVELEWDEHDATSLHALAEHGGAPIGTGRLLGDGHIGRMAVLQPWRGRGVGGALLERLLHAAKERGFSEIRLNAQTAAIGFYQRYGFTAVGEVFMDAGIPHREMIRRL